jgi:hypothetical protein
MAKTDEPSVLAELRAALQRKGGGRRSPLFRWMYRNHDALAEMFAEARPNWQQVAAVLTGRGFTGNEGRPLRPETVRKLWLRVRQRHGKAQAAGKPRAATPPAVTAAEAPAEMPRDAADMLADLRRQMDRRSGRT